MKKLLYLTLFSALLLSVLSRQETAVTQANQPSGPGPMTQTIILKPSQDNTIYEGGNNSNGAGDYLFAGRTGEITQGVIRRGLVQFDMSSIPPASTIITASLTMTMSKAQGGTHNFTIHRTTAAWGEGSSDAGPRGGEGATATVNDATWMHSFFNMQFWTTPGGDFDSTVTAVTAVSGNGPYTWQSSQLVADIQQWSNRPSDNNGWTLRGDETVLFSAKRFNSREFSTSGGPQLRVEYIPSKQVFLPAVYSP
jgi:hypothetical protein